MDKSEAIASVEDAIRKLVQLSSKEKIWTQEMLLQVNDQSLRLLDIESQVPRWEGGAGWSCPAGAGSDAELWACLWDLKAEGRGQGGPGGAGVWGATPHRATFPPPPARALQGWTRRASGVDLAGCRPRLCAGPFLRCVCGVKAAGQSARVHGAPP